MPSKHAKHKKYSNIANYLSLTNNLEETNRCWIIYGLNRIGILIWKYMNSFLEYQEDAALYIPSPKF